MLATFCEPQSRRTKPSGFTLVELLIVITIIGMLIALLMPAVNSAQESGRRARCMNNTRQLAVACLAHESTNTFLPGGGWGWGWVGDADRGAGIRQPGGWIYNILPFIDQNDLHDMGKGVSPSQKMVLHGQRVGVALPITICPTRRKVQAFTGVAHGQGNFNWPPMLARSDYATNAGDLPCEPSNMNLWGSNCGNGDCGPPASSIPSDPTLSQLKSVVEAYGPTGIDYPLATLSTAAIKDGPSYTYLLGEKAIQKDWYLTGQSQGDNENQYTGFNADTSRWTYDPPSQDRPGLDNDNDFGSAHTAGFNMAFCDGSARQMSYVIDPVVHRQLGNRKDGEPTQLQNLDIK